jgi:predicted kinase
LTASHCRKLGRVVATFHNSLTPIQSDKGPGTPTAIFAALRQNFEQIDAALPRSEKRALLRDLESACISDYERLQEHMWQRLADGFVRECHGDLHLGNIVLLDDDVVPFDCLEFNPAFRLVDIQCEIGFLVMDLESRSLPGHANRVLNCWLEHTGDYSGLALHSFYDCYLAMVRAKISLFSATASDPDDPVLDDYHRYIGLAAAGRRRQPRFLCIMMGVSGSGKSTVAEALCAQFSAIRIRSDVERKRLFGLSPGADSDGAGLGRIFYSEDTSDRVFKRMLEQVEELLGAGLPVVVDATFIASDRRTPFMQLARRLSVPFIITRCIASDAELSRRLLERSRQGNDASEAGIEVMLRQKESVQTLTAEEADACVVVDTQAGGHDIALANEVERRITAS